jgi:hypothetical protein
LKGGEFLSFYNLLPLVNNFGVKDTYQNPNLEERK